MHEKKIGQRFAEARRNKGLSQEEAAEALGVTRARISGIENSDSLRSSTIRRLCALYGISIEITGGGDA